MGAAAAVAVVTALMVAAPADASSPGSSSGSTGTGTVIEAESSPYGQVLEVGSGTYAGYSAYQFNRNTASACNSTTTATVGGQPLTCAGAEGDKTADWPIVSTVGKPVAGSGVEAKLLGTLYRKDLKQDQVTYAGKLLYLFDTAPHQYSGVNFLETVLPLPPWHGVWALVSPKKGAWVTGPVTLSTQTQPTGGTVLTAGMFQGVGGAGIVVYTYSKDTKDHSNCTEACALDWLPVISSEAPQISGLPNGSLGTVKRTDGRTQVTYKGHPLYFYSQEVPRLNPSTGAPENPATLGTGNHVAAPKDKGSFSLVTITPAT